MQFQHTWPQVMSGQKTNTRRLVMPGQYQWPDKYDRFNTGLEGIQEVRRGGPRARLLWRIGRTYAVQPGRSKKAVGRIRITAIRRERLQDITEADAIAEGCKATHFSVSGNPGPHNPFPKPILARDRFAQLWDTIHTAHGTRWADNPDVFVLVFALVEE